MTRAEHPVVMGGLGHRGIDRVERDRGEVVRPTTEHASYTCDAAGHVDSWSDSAGFVFACPAEAVLGEGLGVLLEGETVADEVLHKPRERTTEVRGFHRRPDGSTFWGLSVVSTTVSENGPGYAVVTQDLDRQVRYQRMLEEQNERLGAFVGRTADGLERALGHDDGTDGTDPPVEPGWWPTPAEPTDGPHTDGEGDERQATDGVEGVDTRGGATTDRPDERVAWGIETLRGIAAAATVVTDPAAVGMDELVAAVSASAPPSVTVEHEPVGTLVADPDRLRGLLGALVEGAADTALGRVTVRVGPLEGGFYVADDGPGLPATVRRELFGGPLDVALPVVRTAAGAHGWTLDVGKSATGGTRVEVTDVELLEG
jgi:hypothetical protein